MKFTSTTIVWGLLLVTCLVVTSAPETSAQEKKGVAGLTDGAWALQFQINSNFTVQSFEGTTFSLKKCTGGKTAWRAGFSFNLSTQDDDQTSSDTLAIPGMTTDNNSVSINAVIHRVFYTSPRSKTAFFFGVGPTGGYSHTKVRQRAEYANSQFITHESKEDFWSAGVSVVMGAEWFLRRNLSLIAEYGTVIEYTHNKQTIVHVIRDAVQTRATKAENISKTFQFNAQAVKFGVSLYF